MGEWLFALLAALAATPWLQALVAALATFILEDPTTIGAGLLVAEGKMSFGIAFLGVSAGIAIGDMGLYGGGRLLGPKIIGRGPLTRERFDRAQSWFRCNLVQAVVLSRFVPGMRLPTYLGAGVLRAPFWKFAVTAVVASIVWTILLLELTVNLGEAVLPVLGRWRWPVALLALLMLVLLQRSAARRLEDRDDGQLEESPVLSYFEFWPPWIFYFPVASYWLWLAFRHRGLLLPTAANPSIYSGGFIGESKAQILGLLPKNQRHRAASWIVVEAPMTTEDPDRRLEQILSRLESAGLAFPLVAKPDIGQRGDGVCRVSDRADLRQYLVSFPPGENFLLQELAGAGPSGRAGDHRSGFGQVREAGVMWFRLPGEEKGRIFSITLKIFPEVVGNGKHTLGRLIDLDPRARHLADIYRARHAEELDRVIDDGEVFPLVFAGNHKQGTIFRDGRHLVTPKLEAAIETIAHSIPEFWFGRFDIRFDDLESFLAGEDFKIVEINGASGEATHIWDASTRLRDAYRVLFEQFRVLFRIGAANRRRGHPPLGLGRFLRDLLAYRRLADNYPRAQ